MPKHGTVKFSDEAALHAAEPRAKPYKLTIGRSVFLLVQPTGAKWWRVTVRRNGLSTTLSLGTFPQTTLAEAMAERDRIFSQVRMGINPAAARRAAREGATLGSAGVAFSVALSADGALSVTVDTQTLHLTRFQTDAIRSALLAHN